ncbi:hypothetical protein OG455_21455 [Kitasatospora sp. NBC_01287]|uniref:hypothetical protein n=1 Tax=Kitasatospora sp. NBC_01287 TaxID=2903573 RepID=UPI002256DCD2|nr:hypothetical protein [Kitasatospora sp. NBC_01287]MCX4748049.1 hypothetical protein [Kitasatospora sp. NBC_01287]
MTEDQFAAGEPEPTWGQEQALRAMLHRSVAGLQPDPEALPRIRRAIPARRARHRQAWTGAVLIAVVSAAAVPTLGGLDAFQLSDGSATAPSAAAPATASSRPSATAHPGGERSVVPLPLPDTGTAAPSGGPSSTPSPTASAGSADPPSPDRGSTPAAPAGPASSTASVPPGCARADLGGGQATVGAPDGAGWVYGAFTVANVSGRPCLLTDPGTVTATVVGGSGTVRVLAHAAGDPATGLPDPAGAAGQLLLSTGGGYRLPFAFLPDAPCPAGGASSPAASPSATVVAPAASAAAGPTTPPTAAGGAVGAGGAVHGAPVPVNGAPAAGTAAGAAGAAGASPQAGSGSAPATTTPSPSPTATADPAPTAPAAVTVGHRPLGTGPDAADATITGVCGGGTLYQAAPQLTG